MGKLDGKIALVTGGNSGIGLATAKRFVAEGAHVYITGRRQESLHAAVKEIGSNVTAVQGDVSKLDDLDRLFAQIRQEKGKLDVVFANAGGGEFLPSAATPRSTSTRPSISMSKDLSSLSRRRCHCSPTALPSCSTVRLCP